MLKATSTTITTDTQRLEKENESLRADLGQCHELYEQTTRSLDIAKERIAKLEFVVQTIRGENRKLRTQLFQLSSALEPRKSHEGGPETGEDGLRSRQLATEVEKLRDELGRSQRVYLELVNEFNMTKIKLYKSQKSLDQADGADPFSLSANGRSANPRSKQPSCTNFCDEPAESTIVNTDVQQMAGSFHDLTLDSRFVGGSFILKKQNSSLVEYCSEGYSVEPKDPWLAGQTASGRQPGSPEDTRPALTVLRGQENQGYRHSDFGFNPYRR